MNLLEFLEARISADEAREGRKYRHLSEKLVGCTVSIASHNLNFVTIHSPQGDRILTSAEFHEQYTEPAPDERILAECVAKRAIIRIADNAYPNRVEWYERKGILEALAAVYADHEDYREEWAL